MGRVLAFKPRYCEDCVALEEIVEFSVGLIKFSDPHVDAHLKYVGGEEFSLRTLPGRKL